MPWMLKQRYTAIGRGRYRAMRAMPTDADEFLGDGVAGMLRKIALLGCSESTVGLVIPTGYSFNLDGTNIYDDGGDVSGASQRHQLTLGQQLWLL